MTFSQASFNISTTLTADAVDVSQDLAGTELIINRNGAFTPAAKPFTPGDPIEAATGEFANFITISLNSTIAQTGGVINVGAISNLAVDFSANDNMIYRLVVSGATPFQIQHDITTGYVDGANVAVSYTAGTTIPFYISEGIPSNQPIVMPAGSHIDFRYDANLNSGNGGMVYLNGNTHLS